MRLWTRIKMAVAAFFTILFKGRLPAALQPEARVELPVRPATDDAADRAIQLLALLQREGRLVDFLREDLGSYSDAQIGVAARDVHAGCRRVLERYVALEAILPGGGGGGTTVGKNNPINPRRWPPAGQFPGHPPFPGRVLHPGGPRRAVDLPPPP